LSGWAEARAIASNTDENIAKFLYEDIICRHSVFFKLVIDGGSENKGVVRVLADKYRIKVVMVSPYNPHAQGQIEVGHRPLTDALSKMTEGETLVGEKGWVSHVPAAVWADRTTIKASTGMTPFRMVYGYEAVLPIELDVPTWQTLPWNTVRTRAELIAMRAQQIERRDEDIEEARAHLQRMREKGKERHDWTKQLISDPAKEGDLVLLHDSALKTNLSRKLRFWWTGPYRVRSVIKEKGTYFLEELDGTPFRDHIHGNRIKKFWLRGESPEEQIGSTENNMDEDPSLEDAAEERVKRRRNQPGTGDGGNEAGMERTGPETRQRAREQAEGMQESLGNPEGAGETREVATETPEEIQDNNKNVRNEDPASWIPPGKSFAVLI